MSYSVALRVDVPILTPSLNSMLNMHRFTQMKEKKKVQAALSSALSAIGFDSSTLTTSSEELSGSSTRCDTKGLSQTTRRKRSGSRSHKSKSRRERNKERRSRS